MSEELNSSRLCLTDREAKLRSVETNNNQIFEESQEFAKVKLHLELQVKELQFEVGKLAKEKVSQEQELRTGVIRVLENVRPC